MQNKPFYQFMNQWNFDNSLIILTVSILFLYYAITGLKYKGKAVWFWIGLCLFITVECSPLHALGMHHYFSARMITHVVLLLVCGPLMVIGLSPKPSSLLYNAVKSFSSFLFEHSWVGWFSGVGIMWLWHIPAIYNASMANMTGLFGVMPLLHSGSMLLAGVLFSWPLFGPFKSYQIHPLAGVVYLFTACISCSLLGLLITFAPSNTYSHFSVAMKIPDSTPWGITPREDQQAAGLIMWVPCCFVYLGGCIFLLQQWFSEGKEVKNIDPNKLNTSISDND